MFIFLRNGKAVTAEENELFMSIFKHTSEGGDSVVEKFYDPENEEIPNMNFNIWCDVIMNYVHLVNVFSVSFTAK